MDRFSYRGTLLRNDGYVSRDVSVTVQSDVRDDYVYYLADIYVQHVDCVAAPRSPAGEYLGSKDYTRQIAVENGAILAINGDGYSGQKLGPGAKRRLVPRYAARSRNGSLFALPKGGTENLRGGTVSIETLEQSEYIRPGRAAALAWRRRGNRFPVSRRSERSLPTARASRSSATTSGTLLLVVVDGSQNTASKGASLLKQLAELMRRAWLQTGVCALRRQFSVMTTLTKVLKHESGRRAHGQRYHLFERASGRAGTKRRKKTYGWLIDMKRTAAVLYGILIILSFAAPAKGPNSKRGCLRPERGWNPERVRRGAAAARLSDRQISEFTNSNCGFYRTETARSTETTCGAMLLYSAGGISDPVKIPRKGCPAGCADERLFDTVLLYGDHRRPKRELPQPECIRLHFLWRMGENSDYCLAELRADIACLQRRSARAEVLRIDCHGEGYARFG